tara:strand:- start:2524 stop:2640 length:117 start_codon:yes stop_codon:yes gene_type:complete
MNKLGQVFAMEKVGYYTVGMAVIILIMALMFTIIKINT